MSQTAGHDLWAFCHWIERIVTTNEVSAYQPAFTSRFVWDGNLLLAVLNHTNGLELVFMRGQVIDQHHPFCLQRWQWERGVIAWHGQPSAKAPTTARRKHSKRTDYYE